MRQTAHNDRVKEEMAAKQRTQLQQQQHIDDMRWLMSHPAGRRLMHGWLGSAGIFRPSYTGNSETFYREGRRAFGLELLADVNRYCPKSYITMLEEQQNEHRDPSGSD